MSVVKITVEVDGQKTVFAADNVEVTQARDVWKSYPHIGSRKCEFKKGTPVLFIQSINAVLVKEVAIESERSLMEWTRCRGAWRAWKIRLKTSSAR